MNDALDIALKSHRYWRDLGNLILAIGILAEIAIDGFWPRSSTFVLRRPTKPLTKWWQRIPLLTRKGFCVVLAGVVVVYGLDLERREGNKADDAADKIRMGLEDQIIILSPWARRLPFWLAQSLSPKLKPFAGQRAVIVVKLPPDSLRPEGNTAIFAEELAVLFDDSDWRNSTGERFLVPDPQRHEQKTITGILYVPVQRNFAIEIETDAKASARVKAATLAFADLMAGELFINPALINEHASFLPDSLRSDKDLIIVVLGKQVFL